MVCGQPREENKIMNKTHGIITKLHDFIEHEARSYSMDFGCITPLYVYRMWGGEIAYDEIIAAFKKLNN